MAFPWLIAGATAASFAAPSVINKLFGTTEKELKELARKKRKDLRTEEAALKTLLSRRHRKKFAGSEDTTALLSVLAQLYAADIPSREEVADRTALLDPGEALLRQLGYPNREALRAETEVNQPEAPAWKMLGMTSDEYDTLRRVGSRG